MWLWGSLSANGLPTGSLQSSSSVVGLLDLAGASIFAGRLETLRGRTVLLATQDQLIAALALIELDGVAQRIVLCPPDLAASHFPAVIATSGARAWVRDAEISEENASGLEICITARAELVAEALTRRQSHETEWVLLTSGTTGAPKLVLHTLQTLAAAIVGAKPTNENVNRVQESGRANSITAAAPLKEGGVRAAGSPVWSTFYDIRRYGGLQIFLRAVLRGGSLVLSDPKEPITDFLGRAAAAGVTHISGTPSHWRRVLMSGLAGTIAPAYVRLSGEISDQAILDSLKLAYPKSSVAHAFASTEAGVAFEVGDGLAGFPAAMVGASGAVELKIDGGTLHIHSGGNALRYLGEGVAPIRVGQAVAGEKDIGENKASRDAKAYVDTGDRVELRDGRYYFMGRAGGVINVGGMKVHPEEVEAVINSHPWVNMSLVKSRRNPITGAVVAADIVLADLPGERPAAEALTREILEMCRRSLPAHKVPVAVRIVPSLAVSAAGKLVRPSA